MPEPYKRLLRLSDPAIVDDGLGVGFEIETQEGDSLRVCCSLPELGDIFSLLSGAAREASLHSRRGYLGGNPPRNELAAVPAEGIGFQAGKTPNETLLVVRLFGFDVAFSVPSSGLTEMADDLIRTARTLSADQSKSQ